MKKLRTAFIAVAFLFTANLLNAQDKYEFMNINYDGGSRMLYLSKGGKEFSKEEIDLSKKQTSGLNTNPLLDRIKEYQSQGWEVMSITPSNYYSTSNDHVMYFAFLKRKVN